MNIDLPSIEEQKRIVFADNVEKSCAVLRNNLAAPHYQPEPGVNAGAYGSKHLLTEEQGWEPPAPALVNALFEQFKYTFPEYNSDKKLATLLGLQTSGDRRIRSFKSGERTVPYGIWRKFLVLTGRVNQEIIPVMGFFDD
ncbi:hypothetical protein [Serratia fonticola]|uniref:hypothetical protein n=1 Tax=Serratia fonticola TaxID=47917 RepID=UPI00301C20F5